jgi:hypothetical protein
VGGRQRPSAHPVSVADCAPVRRPPRGRYPLSAAGNTPRSYASTLLIRDGIQYWPPGPPPRKRCHPPAVATSDWQRSLCRSPRQRTRRRQWPMRVRRPRARHQGQGDRFVRCHRGLIGKAAGHRHIHYRSEQGRRRQADGQMQLRGGSGDTLPLVRESGVAYGA